VAGWLGSSSFNVLVPTCYRLSSLSIEALQIGFPASFASYGIGRPPTVLMDWKLDFCLSYRWEIACDCKKLKWTEENSNFRRLFSPYLHHMKKWCDKDGKEVGK